MIEKMLKGKTVAETVGQIIPTIGASVAIQAQGVNKSHPAPFPGCVLTCCKFAQLLDLFLSEKYQHHWPAIQSLARDKSDPEATFQKLRKYAWEGSRLSTAAFGLSREVVADSVTIQDGPKRTVNLKKGEHVFVNFVRTLSPD
jgi:hypothetical protein